MIKNEVLAVVGNREITLNDVSMVLQTLNPQTAAQYQTEEGMKEIVKELVNQELFYLDAVDSNLDKEEAFLNEVEKAKTSILKQYAINKLLMNTNINDEEVAKYYEVNKDKFVSAPNVRAKHILVDTIDEANDIETKIKSGISFEDAAKEFSKCPSNQNGGDLGSFTRGMMAPEFEEAAFTIDVDQISAPVHTQFGYHLIKLVEKNPELIKTLDEMKPQIMNELKHRKQEVLYHSKANELNGKYPVKINV